MNVAIDLFNCFVASVKQEAINLLGYGVLDSCDAKFANRGRACVLQSILTEHTLTSLALRKLYETIEPPRVVKFCPQFPCNGRLMDLILTEGGDKYAFEFKRWQCKDQEDEILGNDKDYGKLTAFVEECPARRYGYELIFTVNEDKAMGGAFRDRRQKQQFYENAYQKLMEKYWRCGLKILEFGNREREDAFTICIYLATLAGATSALAV